MPVAVHALIAADADCAPAFLAGKVTLGLCSLWFPVQLSCQAGVQAWFSRGECTNWGRCMVQPAPISVGFKTEVRLGRPGQSAFVSRVAAQAATVSPHCPCQFRTCRGPAAAAPQCQWRGWCLLHSWQPSARVLAGRVVQALWGRGRLCAAQAAAALPAQALAWETCSSWPAMCAGHRRHQAGDRVQGQEAECGHQRLRSHWCERSTSRSTCCTKSCTAELGLPHTCSAAGRNFLRCVEGRDDSNLNITVINDSGTPALLRLPCQRQEHSCFRCVWQTATAPSWCCCAQGV